MTSLGLDRFGSPEGPAGAEAHLRAIAAKQERIAASEQRWEVHHIRSRIEAAMAPELRETREIQDIGETSP